MRDLKKRVSADGGAKVYRSNDFLVSGVSVGRLHRLAEAIRRGWELRPTKVKRQLRRGKCEASALGAVAVRMVRGIDQCWLRGSSAGFT
jgi:hypothetical protein